MTPIYDITQSSGLPGSMIRVGMFTDTMQNFPCGGTLSRLGHCASPGAGLG